MANEIPAFLAKVTDPACWCVAVVAGIAPLVVPSPFGYIVGSIVGVALVLGLALLERMDGRDLDDQEEAEPRRRGARFGKPILARRVRFAVGRTPSQSHVLSVARRGLG
jgi:hypothetical protein